MSQYVEEMEGAGWVPLNITNAELEAVAEREKYHEGQSPRQNRGRPENLQPPPVTSVPVEIRVNGEVVALS